MAKLLSQTNSSELALTNEQGSSQECCDSSDIAAQLNTIESHLVELTDSLSARPGDYPDFDFVDEKHRLQGALQRQGDLLHTLTNGLEQFEDRITNRLIQVLRETYAGVDRSPDDEIPVSEATPPPADSDTLSLCESAASTVDESWDAIRRAMMESAAEDSAEAPIEETPLNSVADPELDNGVVEPIRDHESGGTIEPVHFDIPEPIDAAGITDTNLRDAVLAREDIMRVMASRLRQRIELAAPVSTEQLRELTDKLPDQFRDQVRKTLALLDGQLRLTELELSLERARLGRQTAQLEASQAAIQSTARQLGCTVLEDGTLQGIVPASEDARRGRRWMRVLGFGK